MASPPAAPAKGKAPKPVPDEPKEPGFCKTYCHSPSELNANGNKIMKYKPFALFTPLGFVCSEFKTTIFHSWQLWTNTLIIIMFGVVYGSAICGEPRCSDSDPNTTAWKALNCRSYWGDGVCFKELDITLGLFTNTIISLLASFFVNITYQRYWSVRERIGGLTKGVQTVALLLGSVVEGADEATQHVRGTIVRYLNLTHSLVYKLAQGSNSVKEEMSLGLISKQEWELIKPLPNRPQVPAMWAAQLVHRMRLEGKIRSDFDKSQMMEAITLMRDNIDALMSFINVQIPFTYVHIMTVLIKIHMVLTAVVGGTFLGRGFRWASPNQICWGMTIICVNSIFFEGILIFHDLIQSPCGHDITDFPTGAYVLNNYKASMALIGAPPPYDQGVFGNGVKDLEPETAAQHLAPPPPQKMYYAGSEAYAPMGYAPAGGPYWPSNPAPMGSMNIARY